MAYASKYIEVVEAIMEKATRQESIHQAADCIVDSYEKDGMLHVFGTGHSHMMALELFYRAGGLVKINPILNEGLMLHATATGSTAVERLEGYASIVFNQYEIKPKDTIIICSNSGINATTVEMAQICHDQGTTVIALTNMRQSISQKSRTKSGKKLYELADVVIDNYGEIGDATVAIGDTGYRMGPTSNVIGGVLLNILVIEVVEKLQQKGIPLEIFTSSNVAGGDVVNQKYIERYKNKIRNL